MTVLGFQIVQSAVVLGLINGMVYGVLAVGLVLVYRSSRVINFAHGQIGAFGASMMAVFALHWHLPYYLAFMLAIGVAAAISALTEAVVVRRLREAPLVMTIVATVGVGAVLTSLSIALNPTRNAIFPKPPGFPTFSVGQLRVDRASSALLFICPALVVALALFFRRSRFGLAMRGSAANPGSATLAGISSTGMSQLAWALAGAVSGLTAILVVPDRGISDSASFGPSLLLLALVGAVLARMTSLPRALAGGLFVGVVESLMNWNYPRSGPTDLVLFGVLLVALLFQHREPSRRRDAGGYAAVQPWRNLPPQVGALPSVRRIRPALVLVCALVAVGLTPVITNRSASVLIGVICFALIGVSIVLITGVGGQVSLGQFGIAAVGAAVSFRLSEHSHNYLLAFAGAGLAAAATSVLIGLPALRLRGLMLAVTSLAFARVAITWLLPQTWVLGGGVRPGPPGFGSLIFNTTKGYYLFALAIFAFAMLIAYNYRTSGFGLRLAAVRDNEDAARSFSVPATRDKLVAFAVAGFLTGLGGALYGHSLTFLGADAFPLSASVNVVALSALGGIGILGGPVLGALYIIALPAFIHLDAATLAFSSLGWLVLVVAFPGGLAQTVRPLREAAVAWVAGRNGVDYRALATERGAGGPRTGAALPQVDLRHPSSSSDTRSTEVLLDVNALSKSYGAVRAVDDVSLRVFEGEVLGLIGPNGAGKTTLFELCGGFSRPDAGTLTFAGADITRASAEHRARSGLVRSFQDSQLFPTMTVFEALELAQERLAPSRFLPAIVGWRSAKRAKEGKAAELAALMGLTSYGDHLASELSTGTRRIVELACLVELRPRLVLLDEPSSGIAQSETDALADVILGVTRHLGATVVLIEHDMSLIAKVSDRIIAMETGRIIAEGTPDEVFADAAVARSYLGGELSAAPTSTPSDQCRAVTRAGSRCTRRAKVDSLCGTHLQQLAVTERTAAREDQNGICGPAYRQQ
ncbi:MAG: ABC transporter permease subunit [Acidimicrobiales bacterium]